MEHLYRRCNDAVNHNGANNAYILQDFSPCNIIGVRDDYMQQLAVLKTHAMLHRLHASVRGGGGGGGVSQLFWKRYNVSHSS